MHLAELKAKSPADLLSYAESLQIENASSLRKQDMMFAILKNLAENDQSCPTGSASCAVRKPIICPGPMIST
jgi:transcription termination factor Rho